MIRVYRVLRKVVLPDRHYYETSHMDVDRPSEAAFEEYEREHLTVAKGVYSFASWNRDDERGRVT